MKALLKNLSLKNKLMAIVMLAAGLAICLNFIVTVTIDRVDSRREILNRLRVIAKLTAESCQVPLTFDDFDAAGANLQNLRRTPQVIDAHLYDHNEQHVASYTAKDVTPPAFDPKHAAARGYLVVSEPVLFSDNQHGLLYVRADEQAYLGKVRQRLTLAVTLFICSMALVYALALQLQGAITRPILQLAGAAKRIAAERDYAIRVPQGGADEVGALCDGFNTMLSEIHKSETVLRESETRFRTLVANIPGVTYRCAIDDARTMQFISNDILAVSGYPPEDFVDNSKRSYRSIIHSDDVERVQNAIRASHEHQQPFAIEYQITRRDGAVRWVFEKGQVVGNNGDASHYIDGLILDVTDRHESEERQLLMVRELDHRVKNNLAAVAAIAEQTLATTESTEDFREAYLGRLHAMAGTHEVLARAHWGDLPIDEIAARSLSTISESHGGRIHFDGPSIRLTPIAASPIALTLHELATNAMKYGALTRPEGEIHVRWRLTDAHHIQLTWEETGGPPAQAPTRQGLGTRLIRGLIEHELSGTVQTDYLSTGLACTIMLPPETISDAATTSA